MIRDRQDAGAGVRRGRARAARNRSAVIVSHGIAGKRPGCYSRKESTPAPKRAGRSSSLPAAARLRFRSSIAESGAGPKQRQASERGTQVP